MKPARLSCSTSGSRPNGAPPVSGRAGRLAGFISLMTDGRGPAASEPKRLLEAVKRTTRPGGIDDDFTLLTIPMGSVPPRLSELDPETPIACLCHHGGRSMQVAQFLQNQGFSRVANIAGGIHAWADEVDNTIARY